MVRYRISIDRKHMGTVTVDDPLVQDPRAEASRLGIIQRSDVHRASAYPIEEAPDVDDADT